jgi:hypothetical protein
MQDVTTCHPDIRRDETRRSRRQQFDLDTVVRRPDERYVPSPVTCANCGVAAEAFDWYQRLPEGAIAAGEPGQNLHFCSIICLGFYSADRFDRTPSAVSSQREAYARSPRRSQQSTW